jgi:anti-anti-sigma regulatory factor
MKRHSESGGTNSSRVDESTGRIALAGACTIHEAAALKAHMLEQFAKSAPYELDGTAVERIDATGVQLLVAFSLDCLEKNQGFFWKGRSAVLEEAIELMGVGSLLESPGVSSLGSAG